ncbi:MAG: NRDE family protein [Planctomycetota bacterium]|jgi:hypothetical protein
MCLLALAFQLLPEAPVLLAANRDERFDRPSAPPAIQPGSPRVLCPIDETAGGTWLGVNEHGLTVAVTNRAKSSVPPKPRSRGLLCRDVLACRTAAEAAQLAFAELGEGRYAGANYLCADPGEALFVSGGDLHAILDLKPGVHLVTNGDLDDPADERVQRARELLERAEIDCVDDFVLLAMVTCTDGRLVIRDADGGTVSSQILAVTADPQAARYLHAPGPPDTTPYEDLSDLLRGLRGPPDPGRTGGERRT